MGTFFQQYGVEEERRGRVIARIAYSLVSIVVLAVFGYFLLHDYPEKRAANAFLQQVNTGNYKEAYRQWGCTSEHPCPNYDFQRFLEDWRPAKKPTSPWKVASVNGCRQFVTINVQAPGSDLASLSVLRSDNSLGFAPSPECQERQWHWKQFFRGLAGDSGPPPSKP